MDWGHALLYVVNVTRIDLNQFWVANRLICSFCEAMAGSLSMATIAASSAYVAVVYSDEVGMSAVYNRYNNGPRTLPWSTPSLTGESSVYSVPTFNRKCLLCKYDLKIRK
jgi:hypothetical protein